MRNIALILGILISCFNLIWCSGNQGWLLAADDFPPPRNSPSEANVQPMPANQAAKTMQLPVGFRATVFAAEPEVQNPIAMAWDERGRMWVAENYTYSDRVQRFDLSLRDRVLILEDRDGDGRAESRKVFTDNVQMLTSVELGRGGVWLMCPPQLLFIPDANQDDVADGPAEVVLDGFDVAQDNYHNFANGLRWGPDGWLYGRCGHSCPGRVGKPGTPSESRVPLDGGVWRYSPTLGTFEALCHGTTNPWGHDWDANGELFFINTVIGHLWHMTPGAHFKESFGESSNPGVYERMDMIADHYHFDTKGNWTESRDGKANSLGGGHAHIGMLIYQGNAWPDAYRGKLMTLNLHGRRVNVERLEQTGSGFVGRHEPDFMLAEDPFFRGMELSIGPDGQVYVLDWSDTGECHESTGVHRESGRIYKVIYDGDKPTKDLQLTKPACLAGSGKLPQVWKDYQANRLSHEALLELTHDKDEHVRVWGVRLLTDHWPLDWVTGPNPQAKYPDEPQTRKRLQELAQEDESGLMHRVLASTLQRLPVEHRALLARALISREAFATDRDLAMLVWFGLIPVGQQFPDELVSLASDSRWPTLHGFMARYLSSNMFKQPVAFDQFLVRTASLSSVSQDQVLDGIKKGLKGWRKAEMPKHWEAFVALPSIRKSEEAVRELNRLFGDGRAVEELQKIALDSRAEMKMRQDALAALIDARTDGLRATCESLMDTRYLNATAAKGLALFDEPAVGQLLVRKYRRFQPDHRAQVLELLVSRRNFVKPLLDELASGKSQIPLSDVTASHARQILSLNDEALSKRLSEVWGELRESSSERRALIEKLKRELTPEVRRQADLTSGRALFNKTCSQCHVLFGQGQRVGPELTGAQRSSLEYLLENIVDPSAVVSKDYRMSVITTVDGRVLNGLVVSRNDQTLVLRTATELLTLNQADIEDVKQSTLSAMPDGLLQNLKAEEVRDLFAYLMSAGI